MARVMNTAYKLCQRVGILNHSLIFLRAVFIPIFYYNVVEVAWQFSVLRSIIFETHHNVYLFVVERMLYLIINTFTSKNILT